MEEDFWGSQRVVERDIKTSEGSRREKAGKRGRCTSCIWISFIAFKKEANK